MPTKKKRRASVSGTNAACTVDVVDDASLALRFAEEQLASGRDPTSFQVAYAPGGWQLVDSQSQEHSSSAADNCSSTCSMTPIKGIFFPYFVASWQSSQQSTPMQSTQCEIDYICSTTDAQESAVPLNFADWKFDWKSRLVNDFDNPVITLRRPQLFGETVCL